MKKVGLILVVDDSSEIRQLFAICLRKAGYEVLEAATGKHGLLLTRAYSPDLVLLDVRLPDVNGVEVCRQIKNDPSLKYNRRAPQE